MSYYSIPLCLFLCFSNMNIYPCKNIKPENAEFDLPQTEYKNQIPLQSYSLALKRDSLEQLKKEALESKKQLQKEYEKASAKEKEISSGLESYTLKYLSALKKMQSSSMNFKEEIKASVFIEKYSQLQTKQEALLKEQKDQKEKITSLNKKMESYELEMDELYKQQADLKMELDRPEFYQKEVFRDPNHSVEKNSVLPAFGGAGESHPVDLQACLASAYDADIEISKDFAFPVQGGVVSAGTWAYPSGGVHVGLDIAASLYTPIVAVGNGIILYANAPVDTNCGYVGNYVGYPGGGGNTICMLANMESGLYAISYFHMSTTQYVHAGQKVNKNDVIALSGNSGNSSGPHTHVEIFKLFVSYEEALSYFSSTADFSWGCGWRDPFIKSKYGMRIRPESVLL